MSRVYFHSPSGEAALRGSERAWCDGVVSRIAEGALGEYGPWGDQADKLRSLIPASHYLQREFSDGMTPGWWRAFRNALSGRLSNDLLEWRGEKLSSFSLVLNTGLLLGNDTVKLMAFLHGQCEIHGWIAGEDRAWYSHQIAAGLESGLLRREMGWEDVVALLLQRDDEPVVTSYSVTESFPNLYLAGMIAGGAPYDDEDWDKLYTAWEKLSPEQQWYRAFRGLLERETPTSSYRWCPNVFREQKFGHELSFFDLLAPDVIDRVERAISAE